MDFIQRMKTFADLLMQEHDADRLRTIIPIYIREIRLQENGEFKIILKEPKSSTNCPEWWAIRDLNPWHSRCKRDALTNWANRPFFNGSWIYPKKPENQVIFEKKPFFLRIARDGITARTIHSDTGKNPEERLFFYVPALKKRFPAVCWQENCFNPKKTNRRTDHGQ